MDMENKKSMANKIEQNLNIKRKSIKAINIEKKTQIMKSKKNGYIFWIDENVNNSENSGYFKLFKENSRYKKINLDFYCFYNLEEPFDLILNYINYKLLFIIISGRLYPDYYNQLKEWIKFIKCLPICIIFTSMDSQELFVKKKILFN